MKKILYSCFAALAVMAFTACGSDGDGSYAIVPSAAIPTPTYNDADLVAVSIPTGATMPGVGYTTGGAVYFFNRFEPAHDGTGTLTLNLYEEESLRAPAITRAMVMKEVVELVPFSLRKETNKETIDITGSRCLKRIILESPSDFTTPGDVIATFVLKQGDDVNSPVVTDTYVAPAQQLVQVFGTWNVAGVRVKLFGRQKANGEWEDNYFKYYEGCDFPAIREDLEKHDASIGDLDGFDKNLKQISLSPFGTFTLKYADNTSDGGTIVNGLQNLSSWFINWYNSEEVNKYLREASFSASIGAVAAGVAHQFLITGTAALDEAKYYKVDVEFYLDK